MSTRSVQIPYLGVPAVIVTLFLAAPAALAQKSADKAAEDRQGFRESVLQIRGQIDTTLQALNNYVESGDSSARKTALKAYTNEGSVSCGVAVRVFGHYAESACT